MPQLKKHHRPVEGTQSHCAESRDDCSSSSSSSSRSTSWQSSYSSSTSSSCYPVTSSTPEDELSEGDADSLPSSPAYADFSLTWDTSLNTGEDTGEEDDEDEGPCTSQQALSRFRALSRSTFNDKVSRLVAYLLNKYRCNEPTSRAEMLSNALRGEQSHFDNIFKQASECMQLVFGVDVQEVEPNSDIYTLVNTLGLTYDGLEADDSLPKVGILVFVLSIIFMQGDRASEEEIWEALGVMGVYPGEEHVIYGNPTDFLTRVCVQEQYLQYQQVAGSWPARYEFLWGPRAHTEANQLKILEFMANINASDPRVFPTWCEKAIKEKKERAQARAEGVGDVAKVDTEIPSGSSCPE